MNDISAMMDVLAVLKIERIIDIGET